MSVYVSLLRGINVGGSKRLPMGTLRGIYTGLGFTNVCTYLQSGNVIFESRDVEQSILTARIEAQIEQICAYHVEVFICQPHDLHGILTNNPFLNDRHADVNILYVTFLYQPPTEAAWSRLTVSPDTSDEFARGDMAIYLFLPNFYGKSRLSNNFFEKRLGVPTTVRNWNTVNAMYKMTQQNQSPGG